MAEGLEIAREVLTERGFVVVPQAEGTILTTLWHESFAGSDITGVWTRYSVFASGESATESEIRIIRVQRYAAGVIPTPEHGAGFAEEDVNEANEQRAPSWGEHRATATLRGDPTEGDADTFYAKTRSSSAGRDFVLEAEVQRRALARKGQVAPPVAATAEASHASNDPSLLLDVSRCGDTIPGFDDVSAARTLVFGEVPGTVEVPHFVFQVACHLLIEGRAVTVALEIPGGEQQRVDAFLESAGSGDDLERLVEGFFWNRPDQDGRSSVAVLGLLQRVHTLRLAGLPVRVLAMDAPNLTGSERAAAMADAIRRARVTAPDDTFVVLLGNLNVRIGESADRVTTATLLSQDKGSEPLLTLDLAFSGGSAWTCAMDERLDCGITRLEVGPANYRAWGWAVNRGTDFRLRVPHVRRMAFRHHGIDGTYYLGVLTASPPAVKGAPAAASQ